MYFSDDWCETSLNLLGQKYLTAMSDLAPILPQELITDILLRLPAKSIGQFRCVSRSWRTFLSDPQFIRAHLTRHIHDPEKLILIDASDSDHSPYILNFNIDTDSNSSSNDGVSRKVLCPPLQDNEWAKKVEGSCHGLVLLVVNEENSKLMINPTTLDIEKVPNFCLALDPKISFSMYGLGYDCSNDDYKIVALSYYDTDNEHEPDCAETFVDIYSVKMKTWRRLENSPYDHAVPHLASGIFLNDAIHWLACDCRNEGSPSVIAAFNLAREEFDEVPPPKDVDEDKFVFYELTVIGGCLAMVIDSYRGSVDVWVMKEYGRQDSWNKISIKVPDDQIAYSFKPICLLSNEEMVLGKDGEELVLYNITNGTCRNMVVAGMPELFGDGILTFTESLLSPNFNSDRRTDE